MKIPCPLFACQIYSVFGTPDPTSISLAATDPPVARDDSAIKVSEPRHPWSNDDFFRSLVHLRVALDFRRWTMSDHKVDHCSLSWHVTPLRQSEPTREIIRSRRYEPTRDTAQTSRSG